MDEKKNYESCKICGKHVSNRKSLGMHLCKTHSMKTSDYLMKYYYDGLSEIDYVIKCDHNDKWPLCKCGCGGKVTWHDSKYRFHEYVNKHNVKHLRFSSSRQPKFTQEQINHRNECIKKAYTERAEEIGEKISGKLKKAYENPDYHTKLSVSQKHAWQDPETRKRLTASKKNTWAEQHDELCEKIFTPELRRKISLANMRRDKTRTSKKEIAFCEHLECIFGVENIKRGCWVNDIVNKRIMCADAYIIPHRLYVEFDGTYWHGLDRNEEYTHDQKSNMENDVKKNDIMQFMKYKYIRIMEGVDANAVTDLDSLISCAYWKNEFVDINPKEEVEIQHA
jgi:hypothetical protein